MTNDQQSVRYDYIFTATLVLGRQVFLVRLLPLCYSESDRLSSIKVEGPDYHYVLVQR